ncbi:IgaA/UmoB family intracellular growth attenuator [Chitinimonas taiwanensis]|uniref:IgaA/UmoB family intracellular growth attenuator n=1 Tax=Chitinimonas taiwanensis TaxID=240412 RepID=UPI0035B03660
MQLDKNPSSINHQDLIKVMEILNILFVVAILLYSSYSAITYISRRRQNKSQLRDFQAKSQPTRKLSEEEHALVQPFLVSPSHPNKPAQLKDQNVYLLEGEFISHGISYGNGAKTLHDTIAGVDVLLPYDARSFIGRFTSAEVVFTDKYAIVISIEDQFNLAEGKKRLHAQQVSHQQWEYGEEGQIADMENSTLTERNILGGGSAELAKEMRQVRILAQREETSSEIIARKTPGFGIIASLLLLCAYAALIYGATNGSEMLWLAVSSIFTIVAIYLIWRPRVASKPEKVNEVEGTLNLVQIQDPANTAIVHTQLFLGDKIPLQLPDSWLAHIRLTPDSVVKLALRVSDYSVLSFNKTFSVDNEVRRFPLIFWGKHLTITIVGAGMVLFMIFVNDEIKSDITQVQSALASNKQYQSDSASNTLKHPPTLGSMVELNTQVRCTVDDSLNQQPGEINCGKLRWGGRALAPRTVSVDAALLAFYDGSAIQSEKNHQANLMLQMRQMSLSGRYDPYVAPPSIYNITNLSALVIGIEEQCAANKSALQEACSKLKNLMGEELVVDASNEAIGWEKLLAQSIKDAASGEHIALLRESTLISLRSAARSIAEAQIHDSYKQAFLQLQQGQQGAVILNVDPGQANQIKQASLGLKTLSIENEGDAAAPALLDEIRGDWLKSWEAYGRIAQADNLQALRVKGLLVGMEQAKNGDLILELDPYRTPDNVMRAVLAVVALLLGLLLMLVHGTCWGVNIWRANKRAKAINLYYAQQASANSRF